VDGAHADESETREDMVGREQGVSLQVLLLELHGQPTEVEVE